jgi:transcriptional regulator with GAF, ATPase, and Fis domain
VKGETTDKAPPELKGAVRPPRTMLRLCASHDLDAGSLEVPPEGLELSRALAALAMDRAVSRRHARVAFDAAAHAFFIEDLGSSNGTFVNMRRVARRPLETQDVVRLGGTVFVFDVEEVPDFLLNEQARVPDEVFPGVSFAAERIRAQIGTVAPAESPVLVRGPTGTGKELIARGIHAHSKRHKGPLIPVNCATLTESLADAELFGYRKGAFSGADRDRDGLFQAADRGTLFLDEVGDLAPAVQAKVLRVLEDGEVRRVGDTATSRVDVRVLAATSVDVEAGSFRKDLLGRLSRWTLRVPPLSRRRADVAALAFAHARQHGGWRSGPLFTSAAMERLLLREWGANVRELFAIVEQLLASKRAPPWGLDHLPMLRRRRERPEAARDAGVPQAFVPAREPLVELLRAHEGDVARVARALGKDRKQVYRWLERFELTASEFRGGKR